MRAPEHEIQCAFVQWARWNEKMHPALALAFAVPNGGKRSKGVAGKLKAEGARPGVPDWMLPAPNRDYIGLAIEFKAPKGTISDDQFDYINLLRSAGWRAIVCRSPDEAIAIVTDYLGKLTPEQRAAIVPTVHVT